MCVHVPLCTRVCGCVRCALVCVRACVCMCVRVHASGWVRVCTHCVCALVCVTVRTHASGWVRVRARCVCALVCVQLCVRVPRGWCACIPSTEPAHRFFSQSGGKSPPMLVHRDPLVCAVVAQAPLAVPGASAEPPSPPRRMGPRCPAPWACGPVWAPRRPGGKAWSAVAAAAPCDPLVSPRRLLGCCAGID